MRPGDWSRPTSLCASPRRVSPSMRSVRCPTSEKATARFEAMRDFPSPAEGLLIVSVIGPADPYAKPMWIRSSRNASRA